MPVGYLMVIRVFNAEPENTKHCLSEIGEDG